MTEQKQTNNFWSLKAIVRNILTLVLALSTLFALGIGAYNFVDVRIEQAINNEQFIRKVASHIRPYVIFDENESILMDGGAMQYLEEIEVESEVKEGENYPNLKIIVTPKHHLVYPPIIESLLPIMFDITDERGEGNKFIYQLVPGWNAIDPDKKVVLRFRLEILK